jgi:hypothetical protein
MMELRGFLVRLCDELEAEWKKAYRARANLCSLGVTSRGTGKGKKTERVEGSSPAWVVLALGGVERRDASGGYPAGDRLGGFLHFSVHPSTGFTTIRIDLSVESAVKGGLVEKRFRGVVGLRRFFSRICNELERRFHRELLALSRLLPLECSGLRLKRSCVDWRRTLALDSSAIQGSSPSAS